jgi:acetylornithine deacetylase
MPATSTTHRARLSDAELLARLVGFDTTSCNSNLPLVDFLCEYLERPGVRLTRNPSPGRDKANLVVEAGPRVADMPPNRTSGESRAAARRPGLVLCGHMDVVPAREEGWESDPFILTDRGDRYVGRGTCDMKGFLALAANLFAEASERRLAQPLALLFTYDEEVGTLGARHFVETWPAAHPLPSNVLIGEPTELRVAYAHKGHLKLRITLHGRSAHSAYPHLGVNAIEPAAEVVAALGRLRRELEAESTRHGELFPEAPFVPLNVATIHGGAAINVVPDRCVVEIGLRPLPGGDSRALRERVERVARGAVAPLVPEIEVISDSPPLLTADTAPLRLWLASHLGQQAEVTVSFATDAGWLQAQGLDCVLFGPGSITAAHRPNEFVPKADLAAARTVVESAIVEQCLTEAAPR